MASPAFGVMGWAEVWPALVKTAAAKIREEGAKKMYVGRYDNGTGWYEWAAQPVESVELAKGQVAQMQGVDVDVVKVGEWHKEEVVCFARAGQEWQDVLAINDICCICGHDNGPNGELRTGHDCGQCGGN